MREISVERYTPRSTNEWNDFVAKSGNGTFLFNRSYMDYHSSRFQDHSVMVKLGGELSGLFVANERDGAIESHGGLTYGGFIINTKIVLADVIQMFKAFVAYYYRLGFRKILYKRVPDYLHSFPSNEDQFALFAMDANLIRRDTSSVIVNERRLLYADIRSQSIDAAGRRNFSIAQVTDCTRFWNEVLVPNLRKRYDTDPVHTPEEMNMLMSHFPENIRMYEITGPELMAGTVVYVTANCAHTQYLSSTPKGRQQGALDLLIDHLITEFSNKKYFSLGTSNDTGGPQLNEGLLAWKEGFGARVFVHDFYEIDTNNFTLLDRYE